MANNRSPAAREFLRGCHKNDIVVVDKYIQGRIDVDIIFLGMMEAVRHKSWAAFHVLFCLILHWLSLKPTRNGFKKHLITFWMKLSIYQLLRVLKMSALL